MTAPIKTLSKEEYCAKVVENQQAKKVETSVVRCKVKGFKNSLHAKIGLDEAYDVVNKLRSHQQVHVVLEHSLGLVVGEVEFCILFPQERQLQYPMRWVYSILPSTNQFHYLRSVEMGH